jgi:hypothetical protein
LGWAFLFTGLAFLLESIKLEMNSWFGDGFFSWEVANMMMAVTFGGFHLIYAACTWPRRARAVEAIVTPSTDV